MTSKLRALICLVGLFISTTILHAQGSGWEVNPHDYQYDMTVYAQVLADENIVTDYSNYEIAAFVGDECRGIAEVKSQGGYTWLYLRVRSNAASGETVSFKIYDAAAGKAFNAIETVNFESNGLLGMPSTPTTLTLKRYTLGDVNDDGKINIADITGILAIMAGNSNVEMIKEAADVNGDSRINISDITAVLSIMAGK